MRAWLGAIAACAILVVGCGGSDSSSNADTEECRAMWKRCETQVARGGEESAAQTMDQIESENCGDEPPLPEPRSPQGGGGSNDDDNVPPIVEECREAAQISDMTTEEYLEAVAELGG